MKRYLMAVITLIILLGVSLAPGLVTAQGPDAWTAYQLNLRAGPGGSYAVLAVLDANTGLIVEAHSADMAWLLAHTEDGTQRGWVASGYLTYRDGFSAARLPASDEVVTPGSAPEAALPAAAGQPNGTVDSMTLIYSSDHSEYYRLTYWSDGLRVNGFIGFPRLPGQRPAVIYNRGGSWNTGALIGIEIIPLVESGFVAAASQYRGNGGSEGWETFGSGDVNDALNLIPLLQGLPQVNPAQIGMMGGSRGGMVTAMAIKTEALSGQNRIKAAVMVGAISDLFAWAERRPDVIESVYLPLIGEEPDTAYAPFEARSAVLWPELIPIPVLLLHGEADNQVPVEQSQAFYAALISAGQPAELVVYPGDDHPLTGHLGGYPAAVDWFGRQFGVMVNYDVNWGAIHSTTQWFYQTRP